ncbi:hypothetical protein HGRIS_008768 [Hohenbuehelia grisea]|uniref:F-box domain-containing protein n=1 Tax=Hohenbuehelia grisea TaxID=104357 RepID=A0ABR3JA35_9AGAR
MLDEDSATPVGSVTQAKPWPPASIISLPAEILLMIFKIVHTVSDGCNFPPRGALNRFPNSCARVCKYWMQVMSSFPPFWSFIVFIIDDEEPCFSSLADQIQWTGNLRFGLRIDRRSQVINHDLEAPRIDEAIRALLPHISRCRSICISAPYTSGLMPLIRGLPGSKVDLIYLVLDCNFNDVGGSPAGMSATPCAPLLCPSLSTLRLSGHGLLSLCRNIENPCCDLRQLVELKLGSGDGIRYPFPADIFLNALRQISQLETLEISNLELSCEDEDAVSEIMLNLQHLRSLTLSDLDLTTFRYIVISVYPRYVEDLSFTRCSWGAIVVDFLNSRHVYLEDITDCHDLENYLESWQGISMTLKNCPDIVEELCKLIRQKEPDGIHFRCHSLRYLKIVDCPTLPVDSLRESIAARNSDDPPWDPAVNGPASPFINSVVVLGDVPSLSPEDFAWFESKTMHFRWGGEDIKRRQ